MSSAATSSLRRLLFTSPLGHDGGKEEHYVRFWLNRERLLTPFSTMNSAILLVRLLGCYIKKKKRIHS